MASYPPGQKASMVSPSGAQRATPTTPYGAQRATPVVPGPRLAAGAAPTQRATPTPSPQRATPIAPPAQRATPVAPPGAQQATSGPGPQKASKVVPRATLRVGEAGPAIVIDREEGTLGRRADNAYVISDPGVSRVHASIRRSSSGVVIVTDLGSGGGTKVNGERINGPTVLMHGDTVSFGPVTTRFEDPAHAVSDDDETINFQLPRVETGARPSPRQQQVLEGIAQGLTNTEIGERLGVTERTVKAYASELYEKLGVHNRAGAVAEAIRQGLLEGAAQPASPAPSPQPQPRHVRPGPGGYPRQQPGRPTYLSR